MTLRVSVRPVRVEGKSPTHVPSPQPERRYLGPEASNAASGSSPPGTRCAPASRLLEGTVPEGAWGGPLLQIDSLPMALRSTLALFSTFLAFGAKRMDRYGTGAGQVCSCRVREPQPHQPTASFPGKPAERSLCTSAGLRLASLKCQGEDSAAGWGRRREGGDAVFCWVG